MAQQVPSRPRIGVPWRTAAEEAAKQRAKVDKYLHAVERAGGEAVLLSLVSGSKALKREAENLDGVLLTGSPADIDPALYGAKRHPASDAADAWRERTDFTLLDHALAEGKPVLAICYGIQSLNVFLGGSLVQDIPTELGTKICHSPEQDELPGGGETPDAMHGASIDPGRVFTLSGESQAEVNSWHHQSVLKPGRGLRVAARAPDGVVEAVEWTEDSNWVVGVQWHPERMTADRLAQSLFRDLVTAARLARAET
ncbi:MAG TPA: gamma-glutamyl-gamma-aminobutyrate hydrolase family protein [Candidatus Acidoferrales bacterium]|jgi:putative glutamine amidotransferase|nr:gamma-glutamyl-gamma-aminobutyrate hydrolase family protein [Candidatus Acidoferrales bacterium]